MKAQALKRLTAGESCPIDRQDHGRAPRHGRAIGGLGARAQELVVLTGQTLRGHLRDQPHGAHARRGCRRADLAP
jgi:hypothetical protein